MLEAPLIDFAHHTYDERGGRQGVEWCPILVHQETVERRERARGRIGAVDEITLRIVAAHARLINTALA